MSESESDEENIIRYGTVLEPYEEDEVPSKKKRDASEQLALDEHGRRRFHGAFTGGFSAGFGNTVGSQEGWIPTSFKSSRSDKANVMSQRPEDFMDEEDRSEFGIAPRQIQMQSEFSGQKRTHQSKRFNDGPIPGEPVLQQLLRPVHETTVVKMLKAMGWRPGQGTGERLTKKQKKTTREKHKVYGCYLPSEIRQTDQKSASEESDSDVDEFDYKTLFSPDDYEPYVLQFKDNHFGLGYQGLSRHSVLGNLVGEYGSNASASSSHLLMKEKGKKVSIHGQAFGVGALEEDDEDIYAKEDISHYDFALGELQPSTGRQKDNKKKNTNVLEGFVRATKPLPVPPAYPPPALPRGYTPAPFGARRSRFEPDDTTPQRDQALGRHELSADARGALLGEKPLDKKSLESENNKTELIQTEDPISKLLGRNVNFVSTNLIDKCNDNPDFIPITKTKNDNVNIFKPFVSNPTKQARYEKFLEDKGKTAVLEQDEKMDRLSEWERNRELVEFEQAAKLYKPLTGIMGERFTHGSQPDEGALNSFCAVAKSVNSRNDATQDQVDAAAKGLYGTLTRTQIEWRPHSLVCKRFNIPNPFETKPDPKQDEKARTKYSIFEYLESSVHDKESFTKEQSKFSGSRSLLRDTLPKPKIDISENKVVSVDKEIPKDNISQQVEMSETNITGVNKRLTVAELFLRESERDLVKASENDESTSNITKTIEKFDKMELYKAIFLSDSEEDEKQEEQPKEVSYADFVDIPKNVERNQSPPRGIFANIDFDELNSWNRLTVDDKKDTAKSSNNNNSVKQSEKLESNVDVENTYGPKIPENLKAKIETPNVSDSNFKPSFRSRNERENGGESSSSSDSWVEAKEAKHKKKKKKHKKHKSKHKSKHKKKDK